MENNVAKAEILITSSSVKSNKNVMENEKMQKNENNNDKKEAEAKVLDVFSPYEKLKEDKTKWRIKENKQMDGVPEVSVVKNKVV